MEQKNRELKEENEKLKNDKKFLKTRIAELEKQQANPTKESKNDTRLSVNDIKDDDIAFFTGFPNRVVFDAVFSFLNPGENGENILLYSGHKDEPKRTRPRKLSGRDQFLLFMLRLRLGLMELDLSYRFGIALSTVSMYLTAWANFTFLRLSDINIWPSREAVDAHMPPSFKEKYPTTRVIIDCTEIKIEMPSSLVLKSQSYSNYKSANTLKGLIGVTPGGCISFVSQLYTGSISDKEITQRSGLLVLPFMPGDSLMADKGFDIQELLDPLGVKLNIPPFLEKRDQMSADDVIRTQEIASERIHVERAINKIKNFHIFDQVIPLSLAGSINQIWTVCALLTLFQNPIISVPMLKEQ